MNNNKQEIGGKAYNLHILDKCGYKVPEWEVVTANIFNSFCLQENIYEKIKHELLHLNINRSPGDIKKISDNVNRIIINAEIPSEIKNHIKKLAIKINSTFLAVRSSAVEEDSENYSYAGQFDSFLFIPSADEAVDVVKKCWASLYSARSIFYRIQNNIKIDPEKIQMAVILQKMINSDSSGIIFSSEWQNDNSSKIIINSVYGVGEGIVSGLLEPDVFIVNKNTITIEEIKLAKKTNKISNKHKRGTFNDIVDEINQLSSSLQESEIVHLSKLANDIEKIYNHPQDIEWALKDGKIFILQTRPITQIGRKYQHLNIWDNSNIVESYGGLTLPLTFSFASYAYHHVYVQFCQLLMVTNNRIKEMDYFLQSMLGIINGRIYYNLINWYKLTSILPGFKYNHEFMETMMGAKNNIKNSTTYKELLEDREKTTTLLTKILAGIKMFYYHLTIKKQVKNFLSCFNNNYNHYNKLNYSQMTPNEALDKFRELEKNFLWKWKIPIINDFLCMIHFGIFKKINEKWINDKETIINDLLQGEGSIESVQPVKEIINITKKIQQNIRLRDLIKKTENKDCLKIFEDKNFNEEKKLIDNYINNFGYRCINEMKLEQKDLTQDSSFLFLCIKEYLKIENLNFDQYLNKQNSNQEEIKKIINHNLTGFKKIFFFWSLKHAKQAIQNRENMRLCRTRIYGIVRRIFFAIGHQYAKLSIIKSVEDIFYLELSEVIASLDGKLAIYNLQELIDLRKKEYDKYKNIAMPDRFITSGPVYWFNNIEKEKKVSEKILKGTGCFPGQVVGEVVKIEDPNTSIDLKGKILVTFRTDPGWIPLYPSIAGLIIEKGSQLSHSVIVAREMGIPTIIGVDNLTKIINTGDYIAMMDGSSGIIVL